MPLNREEEQFISIAPGIILLPASDSSTRGGLSAILHGILDITGVTRKKNDTRSQQTHRTAKPIHIP